MYISQKIKFFVLVFVFSIFFGVDNVSACYQLDSSTPTPVGFGASYDVLSSGHDTLIKTTCDEPSVQIEVGTGSETQYIYENGYFFRNGAWELFTFSNSDGSGWIKGTAQASVFLSEAERLNVNYLVTYICLWSGTEWKCGCRDSACNNNIWQLQMFQYPGEECVDNDVDGYDNCNVGLSGDDNKQIDCDDENNNINPGVAEQCDGIDNNCDSIIDEGCGCEDSDGDGYDDCNIGEYGDDGKVIDCDDRNNWANPGGSEICDTVDNNCNGESDEGCDDDDDGFCDYAMKLYGSNVMCINNTYNGDGSNGQDCDDTDQNTNPSINESCDDIDNNCNNIIDEGCNCADEDNDGFDNCNGVDLGDDGKIADCNDANFDIKPGATEICDGFDNNCNSEIDEGDICCYDNDGDGYDTCGSPSRQMDCDDLAEYIYPGAPETCDNHDNNCDGVIDEGCNDDGDGYCDSSIVFYNYPVSVCRNSNLPDGSFGDDCDDSEYYINPFISEKCDGVDNNCDGEVDEGCDCVNGEIEECGTDVGECRIGKKTCVNGAWG